jgi:hypothetical protein
VEAWQNKLPPKGKGWLFWECCSLRGLPGIGTVAVNVKDISCCDTRRVPDGYPPDTTIKNLNFYNQWTSFCVVVGYHNNF